MIENDPHGDYLRYLQHEIKRRQQAQLAAQQRPMQSNQFGVGLGSTSYDLSALVAQYPMPPLPASKLENAGVKVGEITGYRCWLFKGGFLKSMAMEHFWIPGEKVEAQGEPGDHDSIGVHAWKDIQTCLKYGSNYKCVVGRVYLWGSVVEHENGYRAQFARIMSLDHILHDNLDFDEERPLAKLRTKYGLKSEG